MPQPDPAYVCLVALPRPASFGPAARDSKWQTPRRRRTIASCRGRDEGYPRALSVAVAIALELLPAVYGDAIWIECARDGRRGAC